MVDLSIVIVNWNTEKFLLQVLDSIFKSKVSFTLDVIVADNNSKDNSVKSVRENFPDVKLTLNKRNIGMANSINYVLPDIKSKYICIMHTDVILRENTLQGMINFMEGNIDCAVTGCKLLYPDGSLFYSTFCFPSIRSFFLEYFPLSKIIAKVFNIHGFYMRYWDHNKIAEVDSVGNACIIIRKEVIEKVGLINSCFDSWLIDHDWNFRIKKLGYKIIYLPHLTAIHGEKKSIISSEQKELDYKKDGSVVADKIMKSFFDFFKLYYGKKDLIILKVSSISIFILKIAKESILFFRRPDRRKKRIANYLRTIKFCLNY